MTLTHERREELRDLAAEYDDGSLYGVSSMSGDAIRELLAALEQVEEWADEQSYPLVMRQGEILTGVANALNGPTPPLTTWSHHDLAEKAAALAATLDAVRQLLAEADRHQNAFIQTGHLRNALDAATLAEGGDPR